MAAKVLVVLFVAMALTWEGATPTPLPSEISRRPSKYCGKPIGQLKDVKGNVQGTVHCVDDTTVCISGLSYDGSGPAVTFWAGKSGNSAPDEQGEEVEYDASPDKLPKLTNMTIVLKLPKPISDYNYFGLWCSKVKTSFGHVEIPTGFTVPAAQTLDVPALKDPSVHNITGATLIDSKTIELTDFQYTPPQGSNTSFAVADDNTTAVDKMLKITPNLEQPIDQSKYQVMINQNFDWTQFRVFHLYDFTPGSVKPLLSISIPLDKAEAVPPNPVPVSSPLPAAPDSTAAPGPDDTTGKGQDQDTTAAGEGQEKEHEGSTTKAPDEESGGLGLIVILGIVGIVVCIGVGLAFFFFFAPGGEETAVGGPAPPGGGTTAATGDGTAGTQTGDK